MGNFQGGGGGNRGGGFRGGNGGGNRGGGGGYRGGGDRGETTMHKAVCDECHKSCEVPFRPSSDKPVYCNECFSSKRKDDDRAPRREFNGPKREFNDSRAQPSYAKPAVVSNDSTKQLSEISAKLDRLIIAIEKLSPVISKADMPTHISIKKAPVTKTVAKKVVAKKVVAKKKK
jgi:CxxC-x17-CxxC domain-containing protein